MSSPNAIALLQIYQQNREVFNLVIDGHSDRGTLILSNDHKAIFQAKMEDVGATYLDASMTGFFGIRFLITQRNTGEVVAGVSRGLSIIETLDWLRS